MPCSLVQGIFGIGGETWGELVVAVASPDEALTPGHLTPDMKGKIVVGGSFLFGRDDGAGERTWALRAWLSAGFMIRICARFWAMTLAWRSPAPNRWVLR